MSASLFFFFWPPTWPGTGPAPAPDAAAPRGNGSGYWPYTPLSDEYWRLWAARFSPVDLAPHAQFDLQAQLAGLRQRMAHESASAVAEAKLRSEIDDLPEPPFFG